MLTAKNAGTEESLVPRKRSGRVVACTILLLVLLIVVGWTAREVQRQQRNRNLIAAIKLYDASAVEQLLQKGADPDTVDTILPPVTWRQVLSDFWDHLSHKEQPKLGNPALLVLFGPVGRVPNEDVPQAEAILKSLLLHGANPNGKGTDRVDGNVLKDVLGGGLAHKYMEAVNLNNVNLLLEHGADPNERDRHGQIPLFYADSAGIVDALVRHGANVNLRDKKGHTALWRAQRQPRLIDLVPLLVKAGATL